MSKRIEVINANSNFNLAKWASEETFLHLSPLDFPNDWVACEKWLIPAILREAEEIHVTLEKNWVTVIAVNSQGVVTNGEAGDITGALTLAAEKLLKVKEAEK